MGKLENSRFNPIHRRVRVDRGHEYIIRRIWNCCCRTEEWQLMRDLPPLSDWRELDNFCMQTLEDDNKIQMKMLAGPNHVSWTSHSSAPSSDLVCSKLMSAKRFLHSTKSWIAERTIMTKTICHYGGPRSKIIKPSARWGTCQSTSSTRSHLAI